MRYNTPEYWQAVKAGKITWDQVHKDEDTRQERSKRSRQTSWRYSLDRCLEPEPFDDTNGYVPEMAERIERDPNLTGEARRCLRIISAMSYRQNRQGRFIKCTIKYLMNALGRSRSAVKGYLRLLECLGYIKRDVIKDFFTRMITGIRVTLTDRCFSSHFNKKWPGKNGGIPGGQLSGHKVESEIYIPALEWWHKCSGGVWRSLMKTAPLLAAAG